MFALPPEVNPLHPGVSSSWLPPIRFELKPYLELCQAVDKGLEQLETRYPSHRRVLELNTRNKLFKRKPK